MGLWMGVCLLCQKCTPICLVLKTCLKFSLYSKLNENSNMMISKRQGVCHTQSCNPSHGSEVIWGMSNMVISKLWDVYCTQSCDPPRDLEITWGLKMSKLLNLIAYSLACLLTCTTKFLLAYMNIWQSTCLESLLLSLRWWLASLYLLVLVEIRVLMLMVNLLNLLFTSLHISSWLLACYLFVVSCEDSLLFCNSC
jgi:hypothetical protein